MASISSLRISGVDYDIVAKSAMSSPADELSAQWTAYSADLRNDFDTFSAAEDAVITAATAAIPGQVSAEVSGQLRGKQDKLTTANAGVNISISTAGVIDVHNNECSATPNSVAIGDKSKSINNYGFVHGRYATNEGQFNAMIAAFNESASGTYNLVAGNQNVVAGNWNTVVGSGNKVTANNFNFANGVGNTIGNVEGAHAEGNSTSALGLYTHTEGRLSISQGHYSHADGDRVSAVGYASHAMGKESYAGGQYSFAIGNYARASGDESFANGTLTRAIGADTHAEGVGTSADGRGAHTEGHNTLADAQYAHAEGESTRAINAGAHSEGSGTSAIGAYSHTEGEGTRASRLSHAEGRMTYASNDYSHTEGNETFANGVYAHAEGYASSAISNRSHAEGQYTISDTVGQHVEGQYNAPATGALHVIGNGTSTANRSNIVETFPSGVNVNGNLIASGVNIIENMNTMAALPTVYSGAQNIVISPVDRDNFEMIKNSTLTETNGTFNYYNNKLYVNMDSFQDGNNVTPRFYVNGSNKHCVIERFNIDSPRVYSLFRGSSIIIDEIKEWGHYNVTEGYNYCQFYYTDVRKLPPTWEGFSGWPVSIGSRMFERATFSDIPTDYTNIHLPVITGTYNFSYMFTQNASLSGGAVEFMDWVLAEEQAQGKTFIKSQCFRGCTAIPNYSTLTADPTYSAFF